MPTCSQRFGVLVLAAGASRRMGQPKALLPWGGESILQSIVTSWSTAAQVDQVAVVVDPAQPQVIQEAAQCCSSDTVPNPNASEGMFSSLLAAAAWPCWKQELTGIAVVLLDQPQFPMAEISRLLALASVHPHTICQPRHGDKRGHPLVLPWQMFQGLHASSAMNLRDHLAGADLPRTYLEIAQGWWLEDADTPEAYQRLHSLHFGATPAAPTPSHVGCAPQSPPACPP